MLCMKKLELAVNLKECLSNVRYISLHRKELYKIAKVRMEEENLSDPNCVITWG